MKKNELESTNKLLKVIIALLLRQQAPEPPTLREQIKVLDELGLKPIEIAKILGRTNIYINKELSGLRKARKQSKKKYEEK